MLDKMKRLLILMDKRHWIRIAVCLIPGIVLTKLASLADLPDVTQTICSGILLIGLICYALWVPIRRKFFHHEESVPDDTDMPISDESSMNPIEMLHKLVELSDNDAGKAIQRIETEFNLHSQNDLGHALEMAYRRICYEKQVLNGNSPQTPKQQQS